MKPNSPPPISSPPSTPMIETKNNSGNASLGGNQLTSQSDTQTKPPIPRIKLKSKRSTFITLFVSIAVVALVATLVAYILHNRLALARYTSSDTSLAPLSIQYPKGWKIDENITATVSRIEFHPPENSKSAKQFGEQVPKEVVNLQSVEQAYRGRANFNLKKSDYLDPYKVKLGYQEDKSLIADGQQVLQVVSSEAAKVANYDAWKVGVHIYNYKNQRGVNRVGQIYYVYIDGYAQASVEFSSPEADSKYMKAADKIVNSLQYGQSVTGAQKSK